MVAYNFETALKRTLVYEGGYSNHPKDPGGVTLEGVIQRVYDGYRDRKSLPRKPLTRDMLGNPDWIRERNEIYRVQYWDRVRGDELPIGVDAVVFDGAVNSGPGQSIKWLQRALVNQGAAIAVDGLLGETTMAAVEYSPDNAVLVKEICGRRLAFLKSLRTWPTFGRGWGQRVAQVQAFGVAQASSGAAVAVAGPVASEGSSAKAPITSMPQPVVNTTTGSATSGGLMTGGGIAQSLQDASTTLMPYSDMISYVKYALLALAVITIGVTIWSTIRANRIKKVEEGEVFEPAGELEEA